MQTKDKIILDLCGGTGSWSDPYREAGYNVRVITLPEQDIRLFRPPVGVYGVLAAPPCTEFSFAKHFHGKGNYRHNFIAGLEIVSACMRIILTSSPEFWCLENPKGYLCKWLNEPTFTFEPWQYKDNYQKRTCLWGKFIVPKPITYTRPRGLKKFSLLKSREIYPEYCGQLTRTERRAITPPGFARAFFESNR